LQSKEFRVVISVLVFPSCFSHYPEDLLCRKEGSLALAQCRLPVSFASTVSLTTSAFSDASKHACKIVSQSFVFLLVSREQKFHDIYRWRNGEIHIGEWKDGQRHGRGTKRYKKGNVYEGEWKNGMRDGRGILWRNFEIPAGTGVV
jgi:hypothetical protein